MFRLRSMLPLAVVALVGAALLGAPTQAQATYKVTLKSGIFTGVINDNDVPLGDFSDDDSALNFISSDGAISFAGYTIRLSSSTNTPGTSAFALQTSNTLTVVAGAGALSPLTIEVFADGYLLGGLSNPSPLVVNNSISTTLLQGSTTASATTLINGGGVGLTTSTVTLTGPTEDDSAASPTLYTGPTSIPFSMTSVLVISGMADGNTSNVTWTSTAKPTPAPGGLVLLATALPMLGGLGWLRRRKAMPTV